MSISEERRQWAKQFSNNNDLSGIPLWSNHFVNNTLAQVVWREAMTELFPLMEEVLDEC